MNKLYKLISVLLISAAALCAVMIPSSAAEHSKAKDGVVYIESYFTPNIKKDDYAVFYGYENASYGDLDLGGGYFKTYNPAGFRGSGFAIGEEGKPISYIVTNAHVVVDRYAEYLSTNSTTAKTEVTSRRADEVRVYFSYGSNDFMRAQIYYINEKKDICILKLPEPTDKRKPLVICRSENIDMDDEFAALGFPFDSDLFMDNTGLAYNIDDITMTRGAISRKSTDQNGVQVYLIDVDIRSGNSGGPLVNSKGEVVGINTYSVGKSKYAVVIDELLAAVNRDVVPYTLSTEVSDTAETESEISLPSETAETTQAVTEPAENKSSGGMNIVVTIIASAFGVLCIVLIVVLVMKNKKGSSAPSPAPAAGSAVPEVGVSHTASITGIKGVMAGRSFPISGSAVIGRNPEKCTICFPVNTQGISGLHCEIRQNGSVYEIIDRGSSCGTFLGSGQKLAENVPTALPSGMYFYLGSTEQLFQINY